MKGELKLPQEIVNKLGKIHISKDVIANISGMAAMECYGLVGMASQKVQDGLAELLGRENLGRGVAISSEDEKLVVDLYVVVQYGTNIGEVANNIIDKVAYTIRKMLGLTVARVNVHVQGVRIGEPN